MGISLYLDVAPERIDPRRWARVFEESVTLLERWPVRPICLAYRTVAGVRTPQYSLDWRTEHGWKVEGDAESLLTGETFQFPRKLQRSFGPPTDRSAEDIVVALARSCSASAGISAGLPVFGAKTQGRPYHELIAAVGTLVENCFPGAAVVYG